MSKQYVYFKDGGIVRRGEIVGENGDSYVIRCRVQRQDLMATIYASPVYRYKDIIVEKGNVYTEVSDAI